MTREDYRLAAEREYLANDSSFIPRSRTVNESYAVGWGSLALINANIAQLKGRSGLAWFFGSLFLGPVVTFLLAILDRRPASGTRAA